MRDKILNEAIRLFIKDGIDLNLDDLSMNIGISKKTIYKNFLNKEDVIMSAIDKMFDDISLKEKEIYKDDSIDDLTKLKRIICYLPNNYEALDIKRITQLSKKYPKAQQKFDFRLSNGWETTLALLNRCIEKGLIKDINIEIFRSIVTGSIERLMTNDCLNMSYQDAQKIMVDMIIDGISIK